LNQIKLPRI